MPRKNVPPQADFGRAPNTLRAIRGATQEDKLLATSRRHMSRIEQDHQMPSIRIIENLAAGLQIHPLDPHRGGGLSERRYGLGQGPPHCGDV